MSTLFPSLFVSHGSPMFALEPGLAGPALRALGEQLPRPRAIAVISPHWMTRGVAVCMADPPQTIHDFGGFDPRLYQMQYPAAAGINAAQSAMKLLAHAGYQPVATEQWGLDHGAWVPLMYLYPHADIPVFQISLPAGLSTSQAFAYGQSLEGLRSEGVLILGTGSLTHNLSELSGGRDINAAALPYVTEFAHWVRHAALQGDSDALIHTFERAPHAKRAHPTSEHYLPLLVALGASNGAKAHLVDGGVAYGFLSMDSFVFGDLL